jgi:hypothetical protein
VLVSAWGWFLALGAKVYMAAVGMLEVEVEAATVVVVVLAASRLDCSIVRVGTASQEKDMNSTLRPLAFVD